MEGRVQKKKRESGEWLAADAETKPLLELQTREMEIPTLYFVSSNLTLHFIAFSVLFFVERVKFALDIVVLYCSFATVCFPTSLVSVLVEVSGLKSITSKHLALSSQVISFVHLSVLPLIPLYYHLNGKGNILRRQRSNREDTTWTRNYSCNFSRVTNYIDDDNLKDERNASKWIPIHYNLKWLLKLLMAKKS
ncbi:hypothetical protein V8G54_002762 [Vigna mungo]|uniref:Uncharacterized protein n=1 Tax=Vigna mungo TaxID=3915 RepID=A0AAQ3PCR9_VIGMU